MCLWSGKSKLSQIIVITVAEMRRDKSRKTYCRTRKTNLMVLRRIGQSPERSHYGSSATTDAESFVPVEAEEMEYIEGGGFDDAVRYLGELILGDLALKLTYAALKTVFIKTGAWAAIKAVGIMACISRAVAIVALAGVVACYGYAIYSIVKNW